MGANAQTAVTSRSGRITAMNCAGDFLPIQTNLVIPLKGWNAEHSLLDVRGLRVVREGDKTTWSGIVPLAPGKAYRFEEMLHDAGSTLTLKVRVTAEADIETEGVFFWLDVPITVFAGGDCRFSDGPSPRSVVFPLEKPAQRHFAHGTPGQLVLAAPKDRFRLELTLDPTLPVTVQDTREWGGDTYSAFFRLAPPLKTGETTAAKITMKLVGTPDTAPAHLTLDAKGGRSPFDGFGGNYCFAIESPATQYTLDHLKVAWAAHGVESGPLGTEKRQRLPERDQLGSLQTRGYAGFPSAPRMAADEADSEQRHSLRD